MGEILQQFAIVSDIEGNCIGCGLKKVYKYKVSFILNVFNNN